MTGFSFVWEYFHKTFGMIIVGDCQSLALQLLKDSQCFFSTIKLLQNYGLLLMCVGLFHMHKTNGPVPPKC